MERRFESSDTMTPVGGTAVSEWMRLADLSADGCSVHEIRNALACLIGIRVCAMEGWTAELREKDARCEDRLRNLLRRLRRERLASLPAAFAWAVA